MFLRARPARLAAMLLVAAFVVSARASGQTVVEVQGGGSSLVDGYGATANFWRGGVDGWIGLGYQDGLKAGAFLRTGVGKDTLRLGNDALVMRFPTDLFSAGYNLMVQGASLGGGDGRSSYLAFAGASASSLAAPSFQATSIEKPIGALFLQRRVSPTVRLTGNLLLAQHQTVMPGIQWQPVPDFTAALVAGTGAGSPYAAGAVTARRGGLGLKAMYAWNPERFRRADIPGPTQTESEKENIALTYDVGTSFQFGVARQHFLQDSADVATPLRATGNSAFASGRVYDLRLTAGLYDSRSEGFSNLSSYLAVGREVTSWLDTELFLLQSRPSGRSSSTTPIVNLRWRLSPRVRLMQQLSMHEHHPTILFGANLITALGEFGADYQIVHQPFQPFQPFRSALNLTARLQLGRYSTSLGTYVRPDGAVDYSASGSTFLYMGAFGGVQPQQLGPAQSMGRYIVRGVVHDDGGAPVEGAAIAVGGDMAFTNSRGEFFVRARRPQRMDVKVSLDEFLLPGHWVVVEAPAEFTAEAEDRARGLEIILRRAEPVSAPPVPAPASPPPAADSIPAFTADTFYRIVPVAPPAPMDADSDRQLLALPDVAIEIAGHTDSSGVHRRNVVLGKARAETVRRYLHRQGFPLERMTARGFGPGRPVTSNRTAEGRALNGRVELRRRTEARRVNAGKPGPSRLPSGRSPARRGGSPRPRRPAPSLPAPPAGCGSSRSSPPGSSRC